MMRQPKEAECPWCHRGIYSSRLLFSSQARCMYCGGKVRIATAYQRCLMLLSLLVGYGLPWLSGVRTFERFALLSFATFLLAIVVVSRAAPLLVPPKLVRPKAAEFTNPQPDKRRSARTAGGATTAERPADASENRLGQLRASAFHVERPQIPIRSTSSSAVPAPARS
jgi:hypothetical protein